MIGSGHCGGLQTKLFRAKWTVGWLIMLNLKLRNGFTLSQPTNFNWLLLASSGQMPTRNQRIKGCVHIFLHYRLQIVILLSVAKVAVDNKSFLPGHQCHICSSTTARSPSSFMVLFFSRAAASILLNLLFQQMGNRLIQRRIGESMRIILVGAKHTLNLHADQCRETLRHPRAPSSKGAAVHPPLHPSTSLGALLEHLEASGHSSASLSCVSSSFPSFRHHSYLCFHIQAIPAWFTSKLSFGSSSEQNTPLNTTPSERPGP